MAMGGFRLAPGSPGEYVSTIVGEDADTFRAAAEGVMQDTPSVPPVRHRQDPQNMPKRQHRPDEREKDSSEEEKDDTDREKRKSPPPPDRPSTLDITA